MTAGLEMDHMNNSLYQNSYDARDQGIQLQIQTAEQALNEMRMQLSLNK